MCNTDIDFNVTATQATSFPSFPTLNHVFKREKRRMQMELENTDQIKYDALYGQKYLDVCQGS